MELDWIRIQRFVHIVEIPQLKGNEALIVNRTNSALLCCEKGSLIYEHAGKRFRSDPRHVLLVPGGISYSIHCPEDSLSYVVNFDMENPEKLGTFVSFDTLVDNRFSAQLSKLIYLWTFGKNPSQLRMIAMVYEILATLLEESRPQYHTRQTYEQIEASVEYLQKHFTEEGITNEVLAEKSGVSVVYFRKLFTARFGMSPMHYIQKLRLEKARSLLEEGCLSVTRIAELAGFGNGNYFSRMFRRMMGMTPTEYIRKKRQEE